MASINPPVVTFQGGIIGEELHNRVDIPSYPQGAEIMTNMRPTLQGPMTRRPPLIYIDTIDTGEPDIFPFVYNVDASYLVKATATDGFEFYANDGLITTPAVSTVIDVDSYTDESTGSAAVVTEIGANIWLDSDATGKAIVEYAITVAGGDTAKAHVLAFEIGHGPLNIRVGSTSGDDDLMSYAGLREGYHRLAFTPGATTVYLQFWHEANAGRYIKKALSILTGTAYSLPSPFADADLPDIHVQQIRDVLYMTHADYWPRRLERRGDRSWSIVKLLPDDGPFEDTNSTTITLTPSDTSGEITLTASEDLFVSTDVGVLYSISGPGQRRTKTASAADVYTDGIKVTGIGSGSGSAGGDPSSGGGGGRTFNVSLTGTFSATVTLQRSSGNQNNYTDWRTYTTAQSVDIYDAQDNQTWFYRLAVKPGDYTSGSVVMTLTYAGGSGTGYVRVIEYTNATTVTAEVVNDSTLSSIDGVTSWARGSWNATDGFPSTITDGFGRLWFGRGAKVWASKSDDFTAFESVADEDDSSFSRNIATPSSDAIRWMKMTNHLIVGTSSIEKVGLGNTQNDPVGPTNFQFLDGSEEGGAKVQPVQAIGSILFVHRSRKKLMQFLPNPKALSETSYIAIDLTARAPEIFDSDIVDIAVQREPERRIYVVLESGRVCELLFRREGDLDVVAWSKWETLGRVEKVAVLARSDEDVVYFIVRRQDQNGDWVRYIERLGRERPYMDCERYHLDSCLGYELSKPDTVATPSGTSGSITVTTDDDAFVAGDVNKILWINGGRATITAYTSATEVTATVTSELVGFGPGTEGDDPCPPNRWGIGTPTSTLTGLDHREGQTVRVWGDQTDLGDYTVSSGSITLDQSVSIAFAGISTRSRWKSLKLAYGAQKGTALGMFKAISDIVILLYKCGASLKYGKSFSKLREVPTRTPAVPLGEPLPLFSGEKVRAFDADYSTDARLHFEIDGPAPATISGYVPMLAEEDR